MNQSESGTKYKVGDIVLCVKDVPGCGVKGNMRAGRTGVVCKSPKNSAHSKYFFRVLGIKGNLEFSYWKHHADCFKKIRYDSLRGAIEQAIDIMIQ